MYLSETYKNKMLLVLILLLCIRIFAMWFIPLTDTTEARYGEIARKMLETGNWITPLYEYNLSRADCEAIACVITPTHNYATPFWAKPPLSFWGSALSMKFFGVNELAARLPSLLYTLGLLVLMMVWLKGHSNQLSLLTILILSTSLLFGGSAGLVMTDLSLIFCSTLSMVSFWRAVIEKQRRWGFLFFSGIGLGMLAKGPLIFVLVGLPISVWTLWNRKYLLVWQRLPWIKGILLTALIAIPWYWLAESKTPGFVRYFIIGEHFNRFLISGWQGDLYGHAHSEPLGMIWLYLFVGFLPWSFLLVTSMFKSKGIITWNFLTSNIWMRYLLCWATLPILFFTFAHNIISPYVLPAMPAAACLTAELLIKVNDAKRLTSDKQFFFITLFTPVTFMVVIFVYYFLPDLAPKRSEKDVVATYQKIHSNENSQLIYFDERLYSAEFYSKGRSLTIDSIDKISQLTTNQRQDFLVVNNRYLNDEFALVLQKYFRPISSKHRMTLYEECFEKSPCTEVTAHQNH